MFCRFCGTENDDSYQHCKKCGKSLGFPEKQKEETKAVMVVEESRQTISDFSVYDRVECPFCGAGPEKCQPIGKADTNFVTGFNFWTGCCGFLLLGPFGVLCGACGGSSAKNSSATYWVCHQCGKEFMSKQSALENAEKAMGAAMAYTFLLSLSLPILWDVGGMIILMIIFIMLILGFWGVIPTTMSEVTGRPLENLLNESEKNKLYHDLIARAALSIVIGLIIGIAVVLGR